MMKSKYGINCTVVCAALSLMLCGCASAADTANGAAVFENGKWVLEKMIY